MGFDIYKVIGLIMGGTDINVLIANILMAWLGVVFIALYKGVKARNRKMKGNAPLCFNFIFWLWDNAPEFSGSLLLKAIAVFIAVRFSEEFFYTQLSLGYSFGIGTALDIIIIILAERTTFFYRNRNIFMRNRNSITGKKTT